MICFLQSVRYLHSRNVHVNVSQNWGIENRQIVQVPTRWDIFLQQYPMYCVRPQTDKWQVKACDPKWHASSRAGEKTRNTSVNCTTCSTHSVQSVKLVLTIKEWLLHSGMDPVRLQNILTVWIVKISHGCLKCAVLLTTILWRNYVKKIVILFRIKLKLMLISLAIKKKRIR